MVIFMRNGEESVTKGFSVKEVIETIRKITGREIKAEVAARREGDPAIIETAWN